MVLHTSLSYLQEMESKATIDFFDEENTRLAKAQMQWFDLVAKGIKVIELDASDDAIENCNQPLIKHLFRNGRLRPQHNHGRFKTPFHLFAYIQDAKESKRFQKQTGAFYISHSSTAENVFGQYLHHFDIREENTWEFATPVFAPHNSMVVADPYLYTRHGLEGLLAMMRCVVPKQLKQPYYIALIGKPFQENFASNILRQGEIENYCESLQQELKSYGLNIILEQFYCNQHKFHDRYIFTNNAIVFLGSGVSVLAHDSGTPHKEGTWIAVRPYSRLNELGRDGVFLAELIERKLKTFYKWLHFEGYKEVANPLINYAQR